MVTATLVERYDEGPSIPIISDGVKRRKGYPERINANVGDTMRIGERIMAPQPQNERLDCEP